MFDKVLIANRGVIVTRILRTLRKLNIKSVVVFAEADQNAPYILEADESYSLGSGAASETYLRTDKILAIAAKSGAQAIHPGYGFLSENASFIDACEQAGIVWLGPTASQVRDFGYKHRARELAADADVPLVPGTGLLTDVHQAVAEAAKIGYPVMLKSTAGGGGIGMHICESEQALTKVFDSVRTLGERNFGDGNVYLEAYISKARHLEVQLFGDGHGNVAALGERDCSTQRRNQKVLEECPAPAISEKTRQRLHATAIQLGKLVNYRSAGTVEFIYDSGRESFYFLEVNTRLQVEHGVTEMVWGVDLVEWMIKLGSGDLPPLDDLMSPLSPKGHAIQARVYAEDPLHDFRPSAGLISEVTFPENSKNIRIDHALLAGNEVTALYDPMLAKVIAYNDDRSSSAQTLETVLKVSSIYGIASNLQWLAEIVKSEQFLGAQLSTSWLQQFKWSPVAMEVLIPGTMTTIQDCPGRTGYWDVGVPPSGPFDDWAFKLGNKLLGNPVGTAGLEITLSGPKLQFYCDSQIVVAGQMDATLDKESVDMWQVVNVKAGSILELKKVTRGMRAYLLLKGGINCPLYLGSKSTFTLGQFGGHVGRALRTADRIRLHELSQPVGPKQLSRDLVPELPSTWEIHVCYGPHGAPDFFTDDDIKTIFSHNYEVHYNSSRTGVRLIGPRPTWARADGGEAGLHPSNIHDNAYAFGTLDFTGDMPIILGPDGPSLGGFVCPATVVRSERWKIGQLAPGDHVKFVPVSMETAMQLETYYSSLLDSLEPQAKPTLTRHLGTPILRNTMAGVNIRYLQAGNDFLLIEFGPMELDISLRFRAHAWMLWLQKHPLQGLAELTPGIRSLQLHFDPVSLPLRKLMTHLETAERELEVVESLEIESRIVDLPLSWNDEACREAIDKYMKLVRPGAPWCPSNLEFIRRINGLDNIDQISDILFKAKYLVLGLGDVYLGAPVATPLDPTQRLVTTKYNPARTWTAENSVGIGGAYLCVYGMEGPGGYQFVGRTLQMWNRYGTTDAFVKPWLLRFFDQLTFHKITHDELMDIRKDFPRGRYNLKIKPVKFKLADYLAEQKKHEAEIAKFKERREAAFQREIADWRANGQFTFEDNVEVANDEVLTLKDGEASIDSPVTGSMWKILVKEGQEVSSEQLVAIVESMKMEINIVAPEDGTVVSLPVAEGAMISAGQGLIVMKTAA